MWIDPTWLQHCNSYVDCEQGAAKYLQIMLLIVFAYITYVVVVNIRSGTSVTTVIENDIKWLA